MQTIVATQHDWQQEETVDPYDIPRGRPATLAVFRHLAQLLDEERVAYCQWKGAASERWRTGAGDVDLLVEHAHADRFRVCATRLNLKIAFPASGPTVGIESYLGFDRASGRIVHIHVYYRVIVGTPQTQLFALPLERALLQSGDRGYVFRVARPEFELIAVTLHRLLRERLSTALVRPRHVAADVASLHAAVAPAAIASALSRHLPELPYELFMECVHALARPHSNWQRAALRMRVRRALRSHEVAGTGAEWRQIIARRLPGAAATRAAAADGKRLATGGVIIALVGGDGAGKSTCAAALRTWLAPELATRHFHLGRPPRSFATLAVGALLKLVRRAHDDDGSADVNAPRGLTGMLHLVRDIGVARDRYVMYRQIRECARRGFVVLCERYPIPENRLLVGPRRVRSADSAPSPQRTLADRVQNRLLDLEARYYERIAAPDVILVLRLEPELAVARKPEEPAEYVRRRATVIWETDWSRTSAIVVNAAQPLPTVLNSLREKVWRQL